MIAGHADELERFQELQARLGPMVERVFPDRLAPRTVVVVPSLTLDPEELAKISGIVHYEERMLCMLMLLRLPRARLIYLSSQPIDPTIIDYFLHLLTGVPTGHARQRLSLFHCNDASQRVSLTEKILARPRLLARIKAELREPESAHMVCFNTTVLERRLALELGIPLYGCDPELARLGNKSGSREIFREAGVLLPEGFEDLADEGDLVRALAELKGRRPELRRAVIKLNDGFSGEGNALFEYGDDAPLAAGGGGGELEAWVRAALPDQLRFEARGETWEHYRKKFLAMGGIVEEFLEGAEKRSPSVQCRVTPLAVSEMISTHDQVLGGPSGQVFLGCSFPADPEYRAEIQAIAERVGRVVSQRSILGRWGIDFVSLRDGDGWKHYAIELNLRKGGTTHPFMMLQFLSDGAYDVESGLFRTAGGQPRYYRASDNLESERLRGLTPEDLIDILVCHELHFHGATQTGVVFHLIGAVSEFGKLGLVCIAESPEAAEALYQRTVEVLERESGAR